MTVLNVLPLLHVVIYRFDYPSGLVRAASIGMYTNGMSFTIAIAPSRTPALTAKGIKHVMEPASFYLCDSTRIVPLSSEGLVTRITGIVGKKVF